MVPNPRESRRDRPNHQPYRARGRGIDSATASQANGTAATYWRNAKAGNETGLLAGSFVRWDNAPGHAAPNRKHSSVHVKLS